MIDDVQYVIVFMLLFNNTSILPVYPSFVMPRASSPAERPGTRASAIEWYPPHAGPSSHGPSDHSTASDVALCCTWGGIDHEKWRFNHDLTINRSRDQQFHQAKGSFEEQTMGENPWI